MSRFKTRALQLALVPVLLLSLPGCGLIGQTIGRTIGLAAGLVPAAIALIPIKFLFSCIPEGTPIDTPEGPRPIESLRPGDTVIGFSGSPMRILQMHGYVEDPDEERFHKITFESDATVHLCDMHRIDGIRANQVKPGQQLGGQIVKTVEIYGGVERSYDLLTEDDGYRISGLPVNSMIEEMAAAARDGVESIPEE